MTAVSLVGRETEVAVIAELLKAVHHSGRTIVVYGEAGVGKSALLASAAGMAADRGMLVLSMSGAQSEMHLPYAALHQLMRPVLARVDSLSVAQRDAVRAAFGMSADRPVSFRALLPCQPALPPRTVWRAEGAAKLNPLAARLLRAAYPTGWRARSWSLGRTRCSSTLDLIPSLVNTLLRWYWTVRTLMNSRLAISGLDSPSLASRAT